MGDWPNEGKLSALNIRRACDASLRRLRTDYIDLYQMHHIDRDTPWDEIWQAMEVLRRAGQDPLRRVVQLRRLAHRPGQRDRPRRAASSAWSASSRSTTWSPATSSSRCCPPRRPTASASSRGRRSAAGCSAACSKSEREGRRRHRGPGQAERSRRNRDKFEAYEDLCDKLGEEPADVALAWLLHQDGVTAPIIGPRTHRAVRRRAAGADRSRSTPTSSPGSTRSSPAIKPAPEHYAW